MGYATVSDVAAYAAKRTFGPTSIPNASQVAKFCVDTSAELDAILAADGYQLPIPSPAASIALLALNRLTALGAWSKVEYAAQVSDDADRAAKLWDEARAEFISGRTSLYDAPRLGGENFARSVSAPTPMFTRDMKL